MHCKNSWYSRTGYVLWALAALAFVLGWTSLLMQQLVFSLDPVAWYWNALVLGILSMGCKSTAGCGTCKTEGKE